MLLTRQWPWKTLTEKAAKLNVVKGKRPMIPKAIRNSDDPVNQALMEAMRMSQKQDPKERATARQIETFLKAKLHKLFPDVPMP